MLSNFVCILLSLDIFHHTKLNLGSKLFLFPCITCDLHILTDFIMVTLFFKVGFFSQPLTLLKHTLQSSWLQTQRSTCPHPPLFAEETFLLNLRKITSNCCSRMINIFLSFLMCTVDHYLFIYLFSSSSSFLSIFLLLLSLYLPFLLLFAHSYMPLNIFTI